MGESKMELETAGTAPEGAASPRIYRVMKADGTFPMTGSTNRMLGVRVPRDVAPDGNGDVRPGTGGMSVQPRVIDIPAMFLPRRLRHLNRNAAGSNRDCVWRMGTGPFLPSSVAVDLSLRPDEDGAPQHGVVEPAAPMPLNTYQSALERTREQWVIDES